MDEIPGFLGFVGSKNTYRYFEGASKNIPDSWAAGGSWHTYPHFLISKCHSSILTSKWMMTSKWKIPGFLALACDTYPHFEFCKKNSWIPGPLKIGLVT